MKMSAKLEQAHNEAQEHDYYWVEKAKLDFAIGLEKQRRDSAMTCAALARKIGASAAYISKIFRGDSNVTIESMVKLARAAGGQLDIQIVDASAARPQWEAPSVRHGAKPTHRITQPTATILDFPSAANRDAYNDWQNAA